MILSPRPRRVLYVACFELIAVVVSTAILSVLSGSSAQNSMPIAIAISVIAVVWNYIFNTLFEMWEKARNVIKRSLSLRCIHTCLFEAGLVLAIVPLYMIWYQIGLWEALKMEVSILIFFLFYTFAFTWVFDLIFPLQREARAQAKSDALQA